MTEAPVPERPGRGLRVMAWLAGRLLRLLGATWRIRIDGPDPLLPGHPAVVAAFWHGNVLVASYLYRDRGFSVAVSRSRDGDRIAALLRTLGYRQPPRGSSTRGGAAALHELVKLVQAGTTVSIQPDGPQGPARVCKIGVVTLARLTARPVTPVAFSAGPALRFRSWDRTLLPLPFAKVHCRYGEALHVPPEAGDDEEERYRRELDARLNALSDALDRELGA